MSVYSTDSMSAVRLSGTLLSRSSSGISDASSASTATFVTSLVFNLAVFGGELAAFTLLRPYFPSIYQPRTYVPPENKRAKPLTHNIFLWPYAVFMADYRDIKDVNGLDAYFFVRFLRMMIRVFVPIWLISWVILLPVDSVGTTSGTSDGLTQFEFGNIGKGQQARLWAHLVLAWVFTVWIWWNIRHEMSHFVTTRQRWLIDPQIASSAQANTILVTGVPQRFLTEAALTSLFSHLPGGVVKVWLNRDLKEMPELHERRVAACKMLESAQTTLLNTAIKRRNKQQKKAAKAAKKAAKHGGGDGLGDRDRNLSSDGRPLTDPSLVDAERGDVALAETLVPREKRPTHRLPLLSFLPSLPLIGKEVDSIDWAREEIVTTNAALRESRRRLAREVFRTTSRAENGSTQEENYNADHPDAMKPDPDSLQTYPPMNSAFVLFDQQIAAHLAAQSLTHHAPYRMAQKQIGVAPEDIIWGNLNMNPYEARVRTAIGWGLTFGLIILWAFPVAFIGIVSNIHSLCSTYSWLAWICKLPSIIVGIISGILPPALLAILMMLLPIVLRLLARFEGMTTRSEVELSLMTRFFLFQVIHSFLIVTLSSGIIAALPQLVENTSSIPSELADNLPKASTFFLTYILLQGLSGTASGFLEVVPLAIYYVKLYLSGSTPRSIYKIKYTLRSVKWGTTFPTITLLVVITLAYSVISPIINGLAVATFFLFYQMWKYHFLWQLGQPSATETGGRFFPMAIQHIFVGIYLQLICLAALFFLAEGPDGKASAVPQGALMIVLIAFTIFFHLIVNNSYDPLIKYLPLTLADQDIQINDPTREGTEQALRDNASANSAEEVQQEKRNGKSPRSRSQSMNTGKGRVGNVEDVEMGTVEGGAEETEDSIRGLDEDSGPKDFYHPASVEPQPTIWMPQDPLGLSEAEAGANKERGIKVSLADAAMDDKGHVDITGAPPQD